MKLSTIALATFLTTAGAFTQGPLTPPGAPAPTMKTLDQIEPRTPIDAAHTPGDDDSVFKITQPGSYYLTGNKNAQLLSPGSAFVSTAPWANLAY